MSRFTRTALAVLPFVSALSVSGCSSNNDQTPAPPTPIASGASACDSGGGPTPVDPVPGTAQGPRIPAAGFLVQEIKDKLYWVTDGIYSCMFLSTGSGVIVVDVPQTLAPNLLKAIASVTSEPVTHVIYSHHHADHIGGAGVMPKSATFIGHQDTATLLQREADPNRPVPTVTFSDTYTLTVGTQTLVLDYHGPNHDVGNIFVYAPGQKVLMLVDVVWPGWAPFDELGSPSDIKGYIAAHDQALAYDFDTLVAGHVNRLGTKADVMTDKQYLADLEVNAAAALQATDPQAIAKQLADPTNAWAFAAALLSAWPTKCASDTLAKWRGQLGGVDVFVRDNCKGMQDALRAGDLP
jgi:glyoxylase-like metal-dependent hydrolase (beta-lactamase superfamily II)